MNNYTEKFKAVISEMNFNEFVLSKFDELDNYQITSVIDYLNWIKIQNEINESNSKVIVQKITEGKLKVAFYKASQKYGVDLAAQVEQLFRKETRNFESTQFKKCLSAGMEVGTIGKTVFPFGWSSLREFVNKNPKYKNGYDTITFRENGTGRLKTFIKFPSLEASVLFTCFMVKKRGHVGKWRSLDEKIADTYLASLLRFKVKYVDLL